jgi:hypothetical protein
VADYGFAVDADGGGVVDCGCAGDVVLGCGLDVGGGSVGHGLVRSRIFSY